jgi:hypothetical protein
MEIRSSVLFSYPFIWQHMILARADGWLWHVYFRARGPDTRQTHPVDRAARIAWRAMHTTLTGAAVAHAASGIRSRGGKPLLAVKLNKMPGARPAIAPVNLLQCLPSLRGMKGYGKRECEANSGL